MTWRRRDRNRRRRTALLHWRDLERGTAMLANLLDSLGCRPARASRADGEVGEALMFYLAVLRAGFVYLPLNSAYQSAEIEYFIGMPGQRVRLHAAQLRWVSRLAFSAGTAHVFTLDEARGGSLLQRAAVQSDQHTPRSAAPTSSRQSSTPAARRAQQGAMLSHRQPAEQRGGAEDAWAGGRRRADPRAGRSSMCTACSSPRTARC